MGTEAYRKCPPGDDSGQGYVPTTEVTTESDQSSVWMLRFIFEQHPTATIILSLDGFIIKANLAALELLSDAKCLRDNCSILEDDHLASLGIRSAIKDVLCGEPVQTPATLYQPPNPDSEPIWLSARLFPINGPDGTITAVAMVLQDVSDSVQMKNEIHDSEERLRLLLEAEEDRVNLAAQVEALNKEMEAFSYSISHDLRAPLRSIDGFSLALLEDYSEILDQSGKDYLQRARNATQRMNHLIDDLLHLSRVTRSEMTWNNVNLSAIAKEIAQELCGRDPDRKAEFTIHPGVIVRGDCNLLRIVVVNLIENAWKFSSRAPVAKIEFGTMLQGGECVYFVRDNGVGFDMAYVDKLFTPFQRLHPETEFPGSGIGLAIVLRIIHKHEGQVWAESEVGNGATIFFKIPSNRRSK